MDGEIEGKGIKTWPDGRRYEGSFKRGEACGEGYFTCPSGESYMGTWVENRRHGQGELVLPRGQGTYTGEFHRHRCVHPSPQASVVSYPADVIERYIGTLVFST